MRGEPEIGQSRITRTIRRYSGNRNGRRYGISRNVFRVDPGNASCCGEPYTPVRSPDRFRESIYSLCLSRKAIEGIESLPLKAIGGIPQSPVYLISGEVNDAPCRIEPEPFAPCIDNSGNI